jgi:hypothetical protein
MLSFIVKIHFRRAGVLLAATCTLFIVGCSGTSASQDTVATVGNLRITQQALSHWMSVVVGVDYFEHVGKKAPIGLASDPPAYGRCAMAVETIVPKLPSGQRLDHKQLVARCRQLHEAILQEAMTQLILFDASEGEASALGIKVTSSDVTRMLARVKAESFREKSQFQEHLVDNDMTISDERMMLKQDLINAKMIARFRSAHPGGHWQLAYGKFLEAYVKQWTQRTTCKAGYVVPQCKQYIPSKAKNLPSPANQLENLAAGR